ncbi:MAG: preprotein translocase subunit SecE [Luteimonas sp.]|nr:preprotein translocase subunit SecE [Luteimonas sp.]
MNSRVEHTKAASTADVAMYAVAVLLVVAGVFAFYWFDGQWSTTLRIAAVVGGLVAALVVFMLSAKGRETRDFLSESRFELRKVVWPTRQEATRLTWVVAGVVVVISLIMAGFDAIVQWGIKLLLGN